MIDYEHTPPKSAQAEYKWPIIEIRDKRPEDDELFGDDLLDLEPWREEA